MRGREDMDRTFLDAASVAGHLIDPGSMFAFLAGHRGELFSDRMFADLFPSVKGASSIPGSVIASVMTLQTLHDYSDRETAEAVKCDLRWTMRGSTPRRWCTGGVEGPTRIGRTGSTTRSGP